MEQDVARGAGARAAAGFGDHQAAQVRAAGLGRARSRQDLGRGRRRDRGGRGLHGVLLPRDAQAQRRGGDLRRPRRGEPLLLPADGGRGHHRAVELPRRDPHGDVQRGHRRRKHRRHEALRVHERYRGEGDGDLRGGRGARGRRQLRSGLRLGYRGLPGPGRAHPPHLLHRLDEDWAAHQRAGGEADREPALDQARHSGDGRQGRHDHRRLRRPRRRRRRYRRERLRLLRPEVLRRLPRHPARRRARRGAGQGRREGQGTEGRRPRQRRRRGRARSSASPSSRRSRATSTSARARETGSWATTPGIPTTATSSLRPSSRSRRTPGWRARRSSVPCSP